MTPPKTGDKTGRFQAGEDARRGHGLPGRSGRKPSKIKEVEGLAYGDALEKVAGYLRSQKGPTDRTWKWCAEWIAKRQPQQLEYTGELVLTHDERRRRIETILQTAASRLAGSN